MRKAVQTKEGARVPPVLSMGQVIPMGRESPGRTRMVKKKGCQWDWI